MTVTIDGTNGITYPAGTGVMKVGPTLMTAQSATGTSVDYTGIPAGVKRITVILSGVSTNGSADHLFQLGAGSIAAAGYLGGKFKNQWNSTSYNQLHSRFWIKPWGWCWSKYPTWIYCHAYTLQEVSRLVGY